MEDGTALRTLPGLCSPSASRCEDVVVTESTRGTEDCEDDACDLEDAEDRLPRVALLMRCRASSTQS